jgi:hypothetical protein
MERNEVLPYRVVLTGQDRSGGNFKLSRTVRAQGRPKSVQSFYFRFVRAQQEIAGRYEVGTDGTMRTSASFDFSYGYDLIPKGQL